MNREDAHRELFGMLSAAGRNHAPRPGLDMIAALDLALSAEKFELAREKGDCQAMRTYAMLAAVNAVLVVYSLDDALS
jgi:hypothetical protein